MPGNAFNQYRLISWPAIKEKVNFTYTAEPRMDATTLVFIPRQGFINALRNTNRKQVMFFVDEAVRLMPSLSKLTKSQRTKLIERYAQTLSFPKGWRCHDKTKFHLVIDGAFQVTSGRELDD